MHKSLDRLSDPNYLRKISALFYEFEYRKLCKSLDEVAEYYDYWDEKRKNLAYLTDGVVVKINSLQLQQQLGFSNKYPRWAIALKYAAEEVPTIIEAVTVQVGRTGALTRANASNFCPVESDKIKKV